MNAHWIEKAAELAATHGPLVRVVVMRADGSVPREAGAAMLVTTSGLFGTIGGGALEHEACGLARAMIAGKARAPWQRQGRSFPLGPSLGQCCGGHVRLLFERLTPDEITLLGNLTGEEGLIVRPVESGAVPRFVESRKQGGDLPLPVARMVRDMLAGQRPCALCLVQGRGGSGDWVVEPVGRHATPLWIYGAGHVGRALVRVLQDLAFDITWVDVARTRFPDAVPDHARALIADDPALAATRAPCEATHIVMTFSHALDLEICHRVLARDEFAHLGLIGSSTKHARFVKRLSEMGLPHATINRLVCPIGLGAVTSKEPAAIAISVAADLMQRRQATGQRASLRGSHSGEGRAEA